MSETTFYKIRHKKTGLFSKGGESVTANGIGMYWNKSGKTWDTLGKLRAHITSHLNKYSGATDMSDWEVVEFKCVPTIVKPIHEIVTAEKLVKLLAQ